MIDRCIFLFHNDQPRTLYSFEDGKSLAVFTSKEQAEKLLDGFKLRADWHAGQMTSENAANTLREAIQRGTHHVILDPDPATDSFRRIPILTILIELEGDAS